jgi:hypothetical protein
MVMRLMEFDLRHDREAQTCMYRDEEKAATYAEREPSVIFFYANIEVDPLSDSQTEGL